jgi:dihydroneopterin aldolase/D-erythro-7,8-dihydroneopterin triphosphate epimerase
MADTIFIKDLLIRTVIGVHDWERKARQDVLINIEMDVDARLAGQSDDFHDTVDYRAVAKRVIEFVQASEFQLVEALAQGVAGLCLEDTRVERVRVRVEKPGALRFARTVGIEIERDRDGD